MPRALLAGQRVHYVPYVAPRDFKGIVRASGLARHLLSQVDATVSTGAGLALSVVGGIQVTNDTIAANQRAFMATGTFLGIALLIAGAALFVRFSMSRYLRFWLIRIVHESRANTDRLVEAIDRAGRGE